MKGCGDGALTELAEPTTTVTVGLGSARAGVAIGKKADGGDLYARDVSKNQVVTIAADLLTDLQKGVTEYRRKDVFEFRPYNLTRLEVTRGADVTGFGNRDRAGWPAGLFVKAMLFAGTFILLFGVWELERWLSGWWARPSPPAAA